MVELQLNTRGDLIISLFWFFLLITQKRKGLYNKGLINKVYEHLDFHNLGKTKRTRGIKVNNKRH